MSQVWKQNDEGRKTAPISDHRTRIIILILFSMAVFAAPAGWFLGLLATAEFLLLASDRVSLVRVIKPMIPLLLIIGAVGMAGALLARTPPLAHLGPVAVSRAVFWDNVWVFARVTLVLIIASWFTATTNAYDLTAAVSRLLSPLERLGLPVAGLALAVSIALTFLPQMREEGVRVLEAQEARGLPARAGGPRGWLTALSAITVPLLAKAFVRADELAVALEARRYGQAAHPTRYRETSFEGGDYVALAVAVALLAGAWLAGG